MSATDPSDVWDLSSYFPAFESEERLRFTAALSAELAEARRAASTLEPLAEANEAAWSELLRSYEGLLARFGHLSSYIGCLASAHALDERVATAEGELGLVRAELDKLVIELRRGLGRADEASLARFVARPELAGVAYAVERLRVEAKHRMAPELEALVADLAPDGFTSWGRLYDTLSAKLEFDMRWPDGRVERISAAQRRSLMADGDREVRRAAFEGGNQAWAGIADVCARALNHIVGTRHVLDARRGVSSFLEGPLFQAAISARTLEAMLEAVKEGAPLARRGLALKARTMGLEAIHWYDLEAPLAVGAADPRLSWVEGVELVRRAFHGSYPSLGRHFDELLETRRVEAEPRSGKRPGAFCTHSELIHETRVFMTYKGSLGDVSTLAHEVGHSFHAHLMRHVRPLACEVPMTLAETASTFGEALLSDGLLSDPALPKARRATLLGEVVGDGAAFLLDIPTRFYFEKKLYEARKKGELTVHELSELMRETQREVFGDALAEGGEDPYFWASKLHFFLTDIAFYNFPYTFGYLLSRGLYALYREQGAGFLPRYEKLLEASGGAMAHEVVRASLGEDLESPGFWARAIETLRAPTEELEGLLAELAPTAAQR